MCSSEFTCNWQSLTVNDLTKLKTLFFIFLLLNAPLCSHSEDKQNTSLSNTFRSVGHKSCNQTFYSPVSGNKQGTFSAPLLGVESNVTEHSHHCVFMFIAQPNEQVSISFSTFKLRSSPPDCKHEFVDFYTELNDQELDLKNASLSSRNCGSQLPKQKVSLKQRLAFVYNNDLNASHNDTQLPFEGKYEFIKAEQFTMINKTSDECKFEIRSSEQRDGTLQSITYPGIYNSPMDCSYKFLGESGQRVKIEFHDFDLFYGGSHCPFDYVRIYDGDSESAPLIGTFCGQRRSFTVFSTKPALYMRMISTNRSNKAQNRGFSSWFEFSDRFVNLGFIEKNNGELIPGTECDLRFFSKGEQHSNYLVSPNYPFSYPSSTHCTYYLYGLHDKFILQKIRIQFEKFELPSNNDSNECSDISVRIHSADPPSEEADFVFCGVDHPPNSLASDGAIMVIEFKTGNNLQSFGQGFKLQYTFETDYRVDATLQPPGCNFLYVSSGERKGNNFNSPRYPNSYPAQITCTYEFRPFADEHIMLMFQQFRLHKENKLSAQNLLFKSHELNATLDPLNGYGDEACTEDWLEIHELSLEHHQQQSDQDFMFSNARIRASRSPGQQLNELAKNQKLFSLNFDNMIDDQLDSEKPMMNSQENFARLANSPQQTKLGRWCSRSAPGPIVTSKPGSFLRLTFKTDLEGFASGFLGTYSFRKASELVGRCNNQFNNESAKSNRSFGIITSPNWPNQYRSVDEWCEWPVQVKDGYRVLLTFQSFSIEGDPRNKGCPNVVVRIWKNKNSIPIDLCGDALTNSTRNLVSKDNYMKVSFISSTKAVGASGFRAIWTEVLSEQNQCNQNQFRCKRNLFCIDLALRCNRHFNCGYGDSSDEIGC